MNYRLLYSKTAFNDIKRFDSVVKNRLKKKLEEYRLNPLRHAKKLTDSRIGAYRWRVGNYRIIFDLKGSSIMILRIGHRREIYK